MQDEILGLQELPEAVGETVGADAPMMTGRTSAFSILSDCTTIFTSM